MRAYEGPRQSVFNPSLFLPCVCYYLVCGSRPTGPVPRGAIRERAMYLRAVLILVVVVTLVPGEVDPATGQFVETTSPRSFCERNPHTCAAGRELSSGFLLKATALAKWGWAKSGDVIAAHWAGSERRFSDVSDLADTRDGDDHRDSRDSYWFRREHRSRWD